MPNVNDRLETILAKSIDDVAAPGGLAYTEQQLYYEFCRHLTPRWLRQVRKLLYLTPVPPVSSAQFSAILKAYILQHGCPAGLLTAKTLSPLLMTNSAPDLTSYGLSKIIICQEESIANMLLANYFHMDLSCAVLSLAAATPLPDAICAMMARSMGACVYFLHSANLQALTLISQLRRSLDLSDGTPLVIVGLRPRQISQMQLFATRLRDPVVEKERNCNDLPWYLTKREKEWLYANWCCELSSVKPDVLFRLLSREIYHGNRILSAQSVRS